MKISELITELTSTLASHGDMSVVCGGEAIVNPEIEWAGSVGSGKKQLNLNYIDPEEP